MTNYSGKEIDRRILNLAWPAILSNITVPLLGLSDTFISGHLGSDTYLAAMAAATTMVNSLYWPFGFLRMGTTGLTATAYGAEDVATQDRVFARASVIALLGGLLLLLLSRPLFLFMKWIMSPPPEVAAQALEYFLIIMLSAPATLGTMTATGRLIGRQNTLYPMIIAISVNVINISLSMTLVFAGNFGFKGVALGTMIANWAGFMLSLYFVRRNNSGKYPTFNIRDIFRDNDWWKFFKVNGFLMIRSLCLMAVTFAMTAFAARIGTLALAVNAVMIQFFIFYSYFIDGFAFSGEALCGRFYGAGDKINFRLTIHRLLIIGVIMAIIFSVSYGVGASPIARALSESEEVWQNVVGMRWICVLIPVVSVAAFIFDGIFVGITRTVDMMYSTMAGMFLFFLANLGIDYFSGGETSAILWSTFLIFLFTRGVVLGWKLYKIL